MSDQARDPHGPGRDPNRPGTGTPSVTTPGVAAEPDINVSEPVREGTRDPSFAHLVRQLVDDVAVLLRKELALATSEVSHSVEAAKQGAVSMAAGGGVLYAGLLFLLASATLGLAEVMEAWLAALIVGGVVAIIGWIMVQSGKKKMEANSFVPHRTADSMRKDKDMVARQTNDHR